MDFNSFFLEMSVGPRGRKRKNDSIIKVNPAKCVDSKLPRIYML